jgi:hypothetical protein
MAELGSLLCFVFRFESHSHHEQDFYQDIAFVFEGVGTARLGQFIALVSISYAKERGMMGELAFIGPRVLL